MGRTVDILRDMRFCRMDCDFRSLWNVGVIGVRDILRSLFVVAVFFVFGMCCMGDDMRFSWIAMFIEM